VSAPRVLVVDDEALLADVIRRLLARDGVAVRCANSGDEALEALAKEDFSMVLCDVRMPRMDGPTLLREARRRGPTPPWVFLTGFADESDASLLEAGACAVIGKPAPAATLREAVRTWARVA
jgi:two-component system cell cycle sensor histidine kinase/response regulator CckA